MRKLLVRLKVFPETWSFSLHLDHNEVCFQVIVSVMLLCLGAASPLLAQVTFDEVEAALSTLEEAVGEQLVPAPVAQEPTLTKGTTLPPVVDISPPPESVLLSMVGNPTAAGAINFLPILTDQVCPQRLPDITKQADALAEKSVNLEAEALELNERFSALEERNRALEIDLDLTECPADFLTAVEQLQGDLAGGDLGTLVQDAETLSVCAQAGVQHLKDRMVALEKSSSDPEAANDRLAVAGVLRRLATVDVQVSRTVSNFVFFDQRRDRLETASGQILRRCKILSGYE